jgi:multiple sugar transport system permease protein/putative aldouronate transport system permease protein
MFSLDAYRLAFGANDIAQAYRVTIFITGVGTFLSMLITSAIGYALSVKTFRLRGKIAFLLYFTMLFNGGLVATFLLVSKYLNMRNTIWVLIIPGLLSAYNILIMRNFFNRIPDSLAESARIDGANEISILFQIIIPISTPGIATISLFYALGYWNEWYRVLLYISDSSLYTLQYLIMRILRQVNYASTLPSDVIVNIGVLPTYSFRMAAITLAIGPIIFLYPFLQKYFVSGLTVGSVKG